MNKSTLSKYICQYIPIPRTGRNLKVPLWKYVNAILYKVRTGVQWKDLPTKQFFDRVKVSWSSVYYHYNKWCKMGVFIQVYQELISAYRHLLDLSALNLDGSHTPVKKGGEQVGYQGRKKCKTSNILILTDRNGVALGTSPIMSGEHNDLFDILENMASIFKVFEETGINLDDLFLNADAGFDAEKLKVYLKKLSIHENIDRNKRNRKKVSEITDLFDDQLYKLRFSVEQCNAWVDNYRTLLVRFATSAQNWLQTHYIAFICIFLRKKFNVKISF